MSHYFYITPEEYATAEANGVDSENLDRRVRLLGWNKFTAINKPLRPQTDRKYWAEIAKQNGINYKTFMSRVNTYGMSEKEAATKPLQDRKQAVEQIAKVNRKYPKELVDLAESNGIPYHTFRARVLKGMDPQEAATKRLMTRSEIGQLGARRNVENNGRFHELIFK